MFDVVIVGGGLSGTVAAHVLSKQGHSVALIDRAATYPPDFRAEQIVGEQAETLRRLGLFEAVLAEASPVYRMLNARNGRVFGVTDKEHFGVLYDSMVNGARAALPPTVTLEIARAAALEAGAEHQRVTLADGRVIEGRLLVLATGYATALRESLGIHRRVLRDAHSLTFGVDLELDAETASRWRPFTYRGSIEQRIDYMTVFPTRQGIRANLFLYRDIRDPWVTAFRDDPAGRLRLVLPGVDRLLGDFRVAGPVQMRVNDLHVVEGEVREGVVVIGDAFQTPGPEAGTGITRLLNDIERLRDYLPGWLATPGMEAAKIAAFYADPQKQALDARMLHVAHYMRGAVTGTGLRWAVHRRRVELTRRLRGWATAILRRHEPDLRTG